MSPSLPVAFIARISARSERGDDLAQFLTDAVDLANAEPGTALWFALRSDETTFWIFDAFASSDDREAHARGELVDALTSNSERLLSSAPEIIPLDVLSEKLAIGSAS